MRWVRGVVFDAACGTSLNVTIQPLQCQLDMRIPSFKKKRSGHFIA